MMIPPLIRIGPIPYNEIHDSERRQTYVALVRNRGWTMVKFDGRIGAFRDTEAGPHEPVIHAEHIVCWMPQDGS